MQSVPTGSFMAERAICEHCNKRFDEQRVTARKIGVIATVIMFLLLLVGAVVVFLLFQNMMT